MRWGSSAGTVLLYSTVYWLHDNMRYHGTGIYYCSPVHTTMATAQGSEEWLRNRAKTGDVRHKICLARFLAEVSGEFMEAEVLFQQILCGLEAIPQDQRGSCWSLAYADCAAWYACMLENNRRFDEAEVQYKSAILEAPRHALALGNYAIFMHRVRRNTAAASALYESALEAGPTFASIMVKYAGLLKSQGNLDRADLLYRRAVATAKLGDADPAAAYATFLHSVKHDDAAAQEM